MWIDAVLAIGSLIFAAWDRRDWQAGRTNRPLWKFYLALAAVFIAFAIFAPLGHLRHWG